MEKYVCELCGYVYDSAQGDSENGIAPGTEFEELAGRLDLARFAVQRKRTLKKCPMKGTTMESSSGLMDEN